MAITGWTNYGQESNYELSNQYVYEGTTSLRVTNLENEGGISNDQTATDSPADIAHEFFGYLPDNFDGFMTAAQMKVADGGVDDTATFFLISYDSNSSELEARLERNENGNFRDSDNIRDGIATDWDQLTLSDGNDPVGRWVAYRIEIFIDDNGDIRARFREDADGDGTWTDILPRDLVISDEGSASDGGAVALGGSGQIFYGNEMWIDASEIYY